MDETTSRAIRYLRAQKPLLVYKLKGRICLVAQVFPKPESQKSLTVIIIPLFRNICMTCHWCFQCCTENIKRCSSTCLRHWCSHNELFRYAYQSDVSNLERGSQSISTGPEPTPQSAWDLGSCPGHAVPQPVLQATSTSHKSLVLIFTDFWKEWFFTS